MSNSDALTSSTESLSKKEMNAAGQLPTGGQVEPSGKDAELDSPHEDFSPVDSAKSNVYVRGIPPTSSNETLVELCQPFGKIVSVKAIMDSRVGCKGYGFVMFATEESATKAIEAINAAGLYQASLAKVGPCSKKVRYILTQAFW